jgi:tetraacyldisaccharide 4'-kinase
MKLKKPKFWDYQSPNFLSYILLPLTFPVIINNFLLNLKKNIKENHKPKKICIGNIYVGGTAKTPLTIKIYQILNNLNIKTATIKKFYKNHYDEQKMLSEKTILYCEKTRIAALNKAIKDKVNVAIFDDGLQDKSINYDLRIVCFNNIKWIGNGFLIPAGPLREKINSISKYDLAFLNGNEKDNSNLKLLLKKYNANIEIFESNYKVLNIKQFNINEKYIIFSGIGNPDSFKQTLISNNIKITKEIIFPDHHNYTQKNIDYIRLQARQFNSKILTTEKDYTKIKSYKNDDIKYLKIELDIKNEDKLIDYLKMHI